LVCWHYQRTEYVRPYVKAQKNDDRDAEATAEAASRPTMRFVELKTEEQLDTQTLHRARERLVGERTALINQLRAILLERGVTVAQGRRKLEQHLAAMFDTDTGTSIGPRMRRLIDDMRAQWFELDQRIAALDNEFAAYARSDANARRLATIPGIGAGGCYWQRRDLRAWARSRGLARTGITPGHDRRKTPVGWHHQTRQQISAEAAHPWRPIRPASARG
jgi:transposase